MKQRNNDGFGLIEFLVVMFVISLMAIASYRHQSSNGSELRQANLAADIINEHVDTELSSSGAVYNQYLQWVAKKIPSEKYIIIFRIFRWNCE